MAPLTRVLCVLLQVAAAGPTDRTHHTAAMLQLTRAKAEPVGRTISSTNLAESTEFLLKYFKVAHEVPSPTDAARPMRTIAISKFIIRFVQAEREVSKAAVAAMDEEWNQMVNPPSSHYSEWVNYHDGIMCTAHEEVMDLDLMQKDGVNIYGTGDVYRVRVPGTAYTLEIAALAFSLKTVNLDSQEVPSSGDSCRSNNAAAALSSESGWFKTTYASHDLVKTMDFVETALGANLVSDPYPWPPKQGCQAARWFKIRGVDTPMLHFVDSSRAYPPSQGFNQLSFDTAAVADFAKGGDFSYADYYIDELAALAARLDTVPASYYYKNEKDYCALYTPMVGTGFVLRAVKVGTCAAAGLADNSHHAGQPRP